MLMQKMKNSYIWLYSRQINKKIFPKEIAKVIPLRIMPGTRIKGLYKGCIEIHSDNIYKGMIQFGMDQGSFGKCSNKKSVLMFEKGAKLILGGRADFAATSEIRVYQNARLQIGEGFYSNCNVAINVTKGINIGNNTQFGWNVELTDTDGHDILDYGGNKLNWDKPINIGSNVWVGARVGIIKGATIPDNCVVGYRSLVNKSFEETNCIIAGTPAKVIKRDINWRTEKTLDKEQSL